MTSPFFKEMMLTDSTFPGSQSCLMSRAGDATVTQPGKRMRSQPCACLPHCHAALGPAAARLPAPAWIIARLPVSMLQPGSQRGCPSPCSSLDHGVAARLPAPAWITARCPSPCLSLDHGVAACLPAPAWITAWLPVSLPEPGSPRGCPGSVSHLALCETSRS